MSDTADPPADLSRFQPVLPRAVREAAARADQLARDIGADPDHPLPTTVVGEGEGEPLGEPGPAEQPPAQQPPTQPPAQPPTPEPPPAREAEPGDFEQRYNSLRGKYDAEVGPLRQQVRDLNNQVAQLQSLMAHVSRQAPPPAAPAAPAPAAAVTIPQEDVEEFGDPLIAAARRWARAEIEPEIADLRNEVRQLRGSSTETQEVMAKRSVEQALDREMAGWRDINDSPEFGEWLQQIDPFSGYQRYAMIGDAYVRGDAQRTAAFFRAYRAEQTAVQPAPGTHPRQTAPSAATIPLADLATPGRGPMGSPAAGGAPAKRTWTRAQIAAFYERCTRGVYVGREAEKARLEADIFGAQSEGRIIG